MSPKILVTDDYALTKRGVDFTIKGLYPDACISSADNFNTSFNTLATNERDVAIRNVTAFTYTRVLKKYY